MTYRLISNPSRRALLAGAAGLAIGMAFAFHGIAAETARKGVLRYATLGLDTSDPHRHTGSIAVQEAYVETLTSIAANGAVEPFPSQPLTLAGTRRPIRRFGRVGVPPVPRSP